MAVLEGHDLKAWPEGFTVMRDETQPVKEAWLNQIRFSKISLRASQA
jgi:hypothetical protein